MHLSNKLKRIIKKKPLNIRLFHLLLLGIGKGFYNLPKPDEGDLFYDIEGFPQEDGRGFEYLHGIYYKNGKNYEFKPFWAKDFIEQQSRRKRKGVGPLSRAVVKNSCAAAHKPTPRPPHRSPPPQITCRTAHEQRGA